MIIQNMKTLPVILATVSILIHITIQSQFEKKDYHNHPCIRPCSEDDEPMTCEYDFTIEYYYVLTQACYNCPYNITDCFRPHCVSADGVSRGIITVNRMLPGPAIHVCKGDTVIVNVKNMLEGGEGVSLHWHGVLQEGTPHMDGVAMLTQCPIHPYTTFQYRFKANDPGTHFWHAHAGLQRTDGLYGSFVIRQPLSRDPHSVMYEEDLPEHTIMINDWMDKMGAVNFAAGHHAMQDHFPSSILINGRGTVKEFNDMSDNHNAHSSHKDSTAQEDMVIHTLTTTKTMEITQTDHMFDHIMHKRSSDASDMHNGHNTEGGSNSMSDLDARHTPHSIFRVAQGKRYRFRLISNGIANCPIQFSVDHHSITMITTDGTPYNPIMVESFTIFAGERYDFVLHANQPIRNYWIRARGLAECGPEYNSISQTAFLSYENAAVILPLESPDYQSGNRPGTMLNPLNIGPSRGFITVDQLDSLVPDDDVLKPIPDRKFYVAMDFNMVENTRFNDPRYYSFQTMMNKHGHGKHAQHMLSPQINHISFKLPPSPPLSQNSKYIENHFCDEDTVNKDCSKEFCECTHRIKVKLDDVVELVLVDEGKSMNNNHPMHLHGHSFRVVAMEKLNTSTSVEYVKVLDSMGQIKRKLQRAVLKDTVTVPDGGYTIIRFKASNAGFWLFHCHIAFHLEMGMSMVIQVGDVDEMPPPPKNFPKCGDWTPDTQDDDDDNDVSKQCPPVSSSSSLSTTTAATTKATTTISTQPRDNKYLGGVSQTRDVDVDAVTLHYVLLLWMTGKKNNNTSPVRNATSRIHRNRHFPLSLGKGSKKYLPKPAYNIHALRSLPDIPIHLTGRARTTLQELLQYAKPMNFRNPRRTRDKTLKNARHKTILGRKLSNIFRKQHYQRLKR